MWVQTAAGPLISKSFPFPEPHKWGHWADWIYQCRQDTVGGLAQSSCPWDTCFRCHQVAQPNRSVFLPFQTSPLSTWFFRCTLSFQTSTSEGTNFQGRKEDVEECWALGGGGGWGGWSQRKEEVCRWWPGECSTFCLPKGHHFTLTHPSSPCKKRILSYFTYENRGWERSSVLFWQVVKAQSLHPV